MGNYIKIHVMTLIPNNRKIRKEQLKGVVKSIQEGANITVDKTDPENPIVSASGIGGMTEESGSFTPVLADGSGGATYSLSSATGNFYRVGAMMFCRITLAVSSTSGTPSGQLIISGLPTGTGFSLIDIPFSGIIQRFTGSGLSDSDLSLLQITAQNSTGIRFFLRNESVDYLDAMTLSGANIELTMSYKVSV